MSQEHPNGKPLPEGRGAVTCRRCGTVYMISIGAKPFRFWYCPRDDYRVPCRTHNEVRLNA